MTDKLKVGIVVAGIMAIVFMAYSAFQNTRIAFASAPSGLPATVATTSNITLSASTALTVFATSTCAARIVAASSTPLYLTFTDANGASPTGISGVRQLASTTVVYDSGQYGCEAMKIWSGAATLITVMETR